MLAKTLFLIILLPFTMGCIDNPIQLELQDAVAKNRGRGGGLLAISLCDGKGSQNRATCTYVAGRRAVSEGADIERDTPFGIASITKTFIATLALIYDERDVLDLDTPIVDLFEDKNWIPVSILNRKFRRNLKTVTIRHLLSHRSGFADYWNSKGFIRSWKNQRDKHWNPLEVLSWAGKMKPLCKVDECFHYSDTNYIIMGLILEKKLGDKLHSLLRKEIFAPLDMRCSWMYFEEEKPKQCKPVAHSYEQKLDVTRNKMQSADWAGGGLYSTLEDLKVFFNALMFSQRLLSEESRKQMLAWGKTNWGRRENYGLGIYRIKVDDDMTLIGHLGVHNAFSFLWEERDILFTGSLNQEKNDAIDRLLYPIMDILEEDGIDYWLKKDTKRCRPQLGGEDARVGQIEKSFRWFT